MSRQRLSTLPVVMACSVIAVLTGYAKSAGSHPADTESAVLVGAGDIADCRDLSGAEATAKLLEQIPGTVMAVGDLCSTASAPMWVVAGRARDKKSGCARI